MIALRYNLGEMSKQALERKLESLESLRRNPGLAVGPLRKALQDRNNFFVSKAAAMAAALGIDALAADLAAAFDRFLVDAAKSDPQCWAKNAIAKALKDLNYKDGALYLRGLRHFQLEASWGGRTDTAATLRGSCALALVSCVLPRLDLLQTLVDLLGSDPEKSVRIDAARAIAQVGGADSVLLLRLKALCGDRQPEVIGQCFFGVLDLSPDEHIAFVAGFFNHENPDLRLEAAAALGECCSVQAVETVENQWTTLRDPVLRRAVTASFGASRLERAALFLHSILVGGDFEDAANALRALASGRFRDSFRDRVGQAIEHRQDARLTALFEKEFATS